MPIQIHAPDGSIAEFPDGTDDATITTAMRTQFGGPKPVQARPQGVPAARADYAERQKTQGDPVTRSYLDSAFLGGFDEIAGAENALNTGLNNIGSRVMGKTPAYSMADAYTAGKEMTAADSDRFGQEHPAMSVAGNVAGAVSGAGKVGAGMIARAPSFVSAVGRSAAVGAALGGANGYLGAGDGQRTEGGAKGAAFGGVVGGAVGPVARVMQRVGNGAAKAAEPVLANVERAKTAAYDAVGKSGVKYKPEAFVRLADGVESALAKAGVNPMRHPRAASMAEDIRKLADEGHAPTLTQLDQLRQVVNRDVVSATDKAERFMGRQIVDTIDKFIEGSPGGGLMVAARKGNAAFRKLEAVDTAVTKAKNRAGGTGSGGNVDNATRQNLRVVMEKTPGLSPEERAAFEKVVNGSGAGQAILRSVGKMSPGGNGLNSMIGTVATMANPAVGFPILAATGAKLAADAMTTRNVRALRQAIAAGGPAGSAAAKIVKANPQLAKAVAAAGISIEAGGGRRMAPQPQVRPRAMAQ